jgi:hypothetical protein
MRRALSWVIGVGVALALAWAVIGTLIGYGDTIGVAVVYILLPYLLFTIPVTVLVVCLRRLLVRRQR